ncbi:MAG: peptide deformylase [Rhodospirillales bacterium]|nr:peptide deformylase [Rhodospirillales bacterium]MSP79466.1 peptide deformylase [Rhodospirillales bacterium]
MAILKIARMGHPVLATPARPVENPAAPEIRALIRDMEETMLDAPGIGLAAPQVHVPLRIVVFLVPERPGELEPRADAARDGADEDPARVPDGLNVLINPVIEPLGEEMEENWEGCLSVPGMTGRVPRFVRIRYSGLDVEGRHFAREAAGFHARVVQHECDHLDGILYPRRMRDLASFGFVEEIRKTHGADAGNEE